MGTRKAEDKLTDGERKKGNDINGREQAPSLVCVCHKDGELGGSGDAGGERDRHVPAREVLASTSCAGGVLERVVV